MKIRTLSLALLALLASPATFAKPLGFLAMRVYLPAGDDISKVKLPDMTFEYSDGSSKTISPCPAPKGVLNEWINVIREKQPDCAWSIALNGGRLLNPNIALPDTAASYWITDFIPDATVKKVVINGTFPNSRYFSFNSYDATGSSFEMNGVKSSIPDFLIDPDRGYQNPWQQPALAGGKYTLNVVRSPAEASGNVLLMPPAKEGGLKDLIVNMPNIKNCNPTCFDTHFFRPGADLISGAFPNSDSAYLISMIKPEPGTVMVIRGKLPAYTPGDTPSTWPSGKQVRYVSLCNNLLMRPYPVVNNGCLTDSELKLDNKGYYTVVVSHIKPVLHNHNRLPFSSLLPLQEHVVALRNMVPDASFSQSAMNVPADNKWTSANHVMKEYYPTIKRCSRLNYALKGRDCQAM